jgi:hypothetical protein
MFRKYYKSMFTGIQPDEDLLIKTKNKMHSHIDPKGLSRMKITRLSTATACLAVIAVVAISFHLGQPKTVSPTSAGSSSMASTPTSSGNSGIETVLQNGKYEAVVKLSNGVLNFVDANAPATSAKLYFDPKTTHEEEWTPAQVVKYLGKDVRPGYLPTIFSTAEQTAGKTNQFVVMNNDGTVNYDNISYYYNGSPDDASAPSLEVKVSKGKLPHDCVIYRASNQTPSNINGHTLSVGYEKIGVGLYSENSSPVQTYDQYSAEFLYDGIGYRVVSKGLPQKEFIKILLSIIQ